MEKALTIPKLAKQTGFTAEFLRAACKRAPFAHPLPHVKSGSSNRPRYYVRESAFEQWVREEEKLAWK